MPVKKLRNAFMQVRLYRLAKHGMFAARVVEHVKQQALVLQLFV